MQCHWAKEKKKYSNKMFFKLSMKAAVNGTRYVYAWDETQGTKRKSVKTSMITRDL